jgi:hypothetical protein
MNNLHLPRRQTVMSTDTPARPTAQAPSAPRRRRFHFEPPPIDPALRKRRIRIARAVCLCSRTKCDATIAARACGLDGDSNALQDIRELCNFRRVPRRHNGVVRLKATPSRNFETFIPRQDRAYMPPSSRTLAEVVQELMAVADPLGVSLMAKETHPDVPRVPKSKPIATCTCGATFEGRAKFCGVRCRVRDWRSRG